MAQAGLECMIFLLLPPEEWDHIHASLCMAPLTALTNSKEEHKPTKGEVPPTRVLKACLFPSHLAPRVMTILPTGLDPPSADDAIQPEFTNQLISNENS